MASEECNAAWREAASHRRRMNASRPMRRLRLLPLSGWESSPWEATGNPSTRKPTDPSTSQQEPTWSRSGSEYMCFVIDLSLSLSLSLSLPLHIYIYIYREREIYIYIYTYIYIYMYIERDIDIDIMCCCFGLGLNIPPRPWALEPAGAMEASRGGVLISLCIFPHADWMGAAGETQRQGSAPLSERHLGETRICRRLEPGREKGWKAWRKINIVNI